MTGSLLLMCEKDSERKNNDKPSEVIQKKIYSI